MASLVRNCPVKGGFWRDYLTARSIREAVNIIQIFGIGYVFKVVESGQPSIVVAETDGAYGELMGVFSGRTPRKELHKLLVENLT